MKTVIVDRNGRVGKKGKYFYYRLKIMIVFKTYNKLFIWKNKLKIVVILIIVIYI
jgi:hypothetical protein